MHRKLFGAVIASVGIITAACSDSTNPGDGPAQLGLMVSTTASNTAGPGFAPESVVVGQHHLVFTKVELVFREIELERVAGTADCAGDSDRAPAFSSGRDGEDKDGKRDQDRDCLDIEIGPLLVDLPLGGGTRQIAVAQVDTGTFRAVEFKIHKAGSRADDRSFLEAHPDLDGISVRVTGTYNGAPFVFTTAVEARQQADLSPPLVIGSDYTANLTLQVEVASWFVSGGVGLIDPATAADGGPNAQLVRQNIQRSFRVFSDHDRDGRQDR